MAVMMWIMGLAGIGAVTKRKRELGMDKVANTEKAAHARADLRLAAFRAFIWAMAMDMSGSELFVMVDTLATMKGSGCCGKC